MLSRQLDEEFARHENWALRRQKGIPNDRRLFVLACMDERLPVEAALGIRPGDAHVFRNAGGLVTDDVIRSAMLTCNFFGTREIIVVNHTECGMMVASGEQIEQGVRDRCGVDPDTLNVDPVVPELTLRGAGSFRRWVRMFESVDETCAAQVELLRSHPLIPREVEVHGYVYEVETGRLRPPHRILSHRVNTAREMRGS